MGLRFCARAFSSCGKRGPLFIAVHGPLTIAASLVAEHRLQTRRLSSYGSGAQLLHGMWDLPKLGLKPVSPALAGRFSTTAPPGKPIFLILFCFLFFDIVLLLFFFFFPAMPCSLQYLGSQARGWTQAPVVGALSPNCWTNREPQTPGNINWSEASQRSSSQHQDPALSNCLQTPVVVASGRTTSKTGIQPHPSKKK